MRSSRSAYPVVNVVHLLGLTLLIGPTVLLDLRLLGAGRQYPLPQVSSTLTRFAVTGLLLLLGSGFLLFSADAGPLIGNPILAWKLLLIVLATGNALLFRAVWNQRLNTWDAHAPIIGRLQAALSIALWLAVGTLGRWIAYS
jgi:hypothetical protein